MYFFFFGHSYVTTVAAIVAAAPVVVLEAVAADLILLFVRNTTDFFISVAIDRPSVAILANAAIFYVLLHLMFLYLMF